MLDVKANYKGKYRNQECRACKTISSHKFHHGLKTVVVSIMKFISIEICISNSKSVGVTYYVHISSHYHIDMAIQINISGILGILTCFPEIHFFCLRINITTTGISLVSSF
jgi:hypothetical protein